MGIPQPEPGLVVQFSYLWAREWEEGQREGRKARPCVLVIAVKEAAAGEYTVTLVPITTQTPLHPHIAMEIPQAIKRHLGMDYKPAWVMLNEVNETDWPGFDLEPVPGSKNRYDYGIMPGNFFSAIVRRIADLAEQQQLSITPRNEE